MKPTNEQKIEALQYARQEISRGSQYICNQLEELARDNLYLRPAANALMTYLNKVLRQDLKQCISKYGYDSFTLDEWLEYWRPHLSTDPESMQRYRLQWIDWMIAQLKEKP